MENDVPCEKRIRSSKDLDRISTLPKEVLDEILTRMPIRDAVKTSQLGKGWKNRWMSIPSLLFDKKASQGTNDDNLAKFINNVLLLHGGAISKFECKDILQCGSSEIDKWILFLSLKNELQYMNIVFKRKNPYKLPACLFACQTLKKLVLGGCILKLPFQCLQLNYLTHLSLGKMYLTNATVETLILKCPLLQYLRVLHCDPLTRLKIQAVNLISCTLYGSFDSISFQNTPKLELLKIWHSRVQAKCRLDEILDSIIDIHKLSISYPSIEHFPIDSRAGRLKHIYTHLKFVKLLLDFDDSNQIFAVLCLCRSSPFLNQLNITVGHCRKLVPSSDICFDGLGLEKEENLFCHLNFVSLRAFMGEMETELALVQFILLNAKVLKTMNITWSKIAYEKEKLFVVEKLMRCKRSSSEAAVVFRSPSWNC
ncbi:hypothetical protein ACHQM5_023286 [Ranunculus cassubicifolius]